MRDNCSTVCNTENALLAVGSAWMGGGCNNRAVAWCQLGRGCIGRSMGMGRPGGWWHGEGESGSEHNDLY